jgi:hypothetical protein
MLYKAIAIVLSTILLAAVQMSTANAGGCHRGGFRAHQASLHQSYVLKQRRAREAAEARAIAAARQKQALALKQARAEKAAQKKIAAAEAAPAKSETATAAGKGDPENELTVAAVPETCTRFFAETGTTVSVDCAKQ